MINKYFTEPMFAKGHCYTSAKVEEEYADVVKKNLSICLRTNIFVDEATFRKLLQSENVPDEVIDACIATICIDDETYLVPRVVLDRDWR